MKKIDTSDWRKFIIGNLFEPLETGYIGVGKKIGTATTAPDSIHVVPLTAAKNDNNGIMYWGRLGDYVTYSNVIAVIRDGAVSTGRIFAQEQETGTYSHSYFIRVKEREVSFPTNLFLSRILETVIYPRYTRDDACIWERIKYDEILLPVDSDSNPDWKYMEQYMQNILNEVGSSIESLSQIKNNKENIDIKKWKEFAVGELFPNMVKPSVLHMRQVVEDGDGIRYVVRTKFNNGIKCRVHPVDDVEPSPAGVITWGAENASFFYQEEPFLSGRDIYYVDTRKYSANVCRFLATCLQTVVFKYPYNFGLFPELLKDESIMLPVDNNGNPDYTYMESYMKSVMDSAKSEIEKFESLDFSL